MSQLRWSLNTPAAAIMATAFLSELTYPLYLLHPLVDLHWTHQAGGARMIYALANAILLLAAATAVHLGIERPFLALRDRHETRRRWKEPAVFQEPSASPLAINPVGLSPRPAA
jgi:peptidoglycan/LPS O-acetylase OafA/YrhL